jgi:O-antigen ligase
MRIPELHLSETTTAPPAVMGWRLPALGFFIYCMIGMGAHLLGAEALLVVAGGLMFLFVLAASCRTLVRVRVDASVTLVLCILVLAFVPTLYDPTHTQARYLVKLVVVCILYVLIFSMELRPIYATPFCKVFVLTLLLMGAVSLVIPRGQEMDDVRRLSGFFVNANNLSLTMMTLLFLIDEQHDGWAVKLGFHAVIILFLVLAGTTGAILAYCGAMVFRALVFVKSARNARVYLIVFLLLLILIGLVCVVPIEIYKRIPLTDRILSQLSLIWNQLPLAVSGHELDYARFSRLYGESGGSGIWRIAHWRKGLDVMANADAFQLVFGHGVGSSSLLLGKLPHNDYLRILIEQGVLGLALSLAFFAVVVARIDWRYRHCIVAVGLYCLCENNMDNLLFMALFVFFLASAQNKLPAHACPRPQ